MENAESALFTLSSLSPCPKYLINPYNAIFLKSQGSKDIKNDILDCQIHKYTNTNSQIHKYSLWWSAGNTQHVLYFWKAKGPRTSNMIFWTVKYTYTQIQMHKYTNTNSQKNQTQIQKYSIWQNDRNTQHMLYFWTADCSRISKIIIPSILIRDTQLTFARSHQVY